MNKNTMKKIFSYFFFTEESLLFMMSSYNEEKTEERDHILNVSSPQLSFSSFRFTLKYLFFLLSVVFLYFFYY